jgi:hypothetical protein
MIEITHRVTFCRVILPFDHTSTPRPSIGRIFDVDNHPMAYVLLMQTLAGKISARVRLRKNDCESEEGINEE